MSGTRFLIDIGSTFTKVVVIDLRTEEILCSTRSESTVDVDVMVGLNEAIDKAEKESGIKGIGKENMLACSSAAGGLKMVCIGFVPDLSLKAGNMAALGAGAKLIGTYSFELTRGDVSEIEDISPDIILLVGGTDGGDKRIVLHNAEMLAESKINASIIAACNRVVQNDVKGILENSGKSVKLAKNVMPEIRKLEVDSCREVIRGIFIENIVRAKGMEMVKGTIKEVIMPTPTAVLNATRLLAEGVDDEKGLGELMVVDVGGATTDVHSVASEFPAEGAVLMNLLPEPYAKRTVEGDIGLRYNVESLLAHGRRKRTLNDADFKVARSLPNSFRLPETDEEGLVHMKLARLAAEIGVERHVGEIETQYGPTGKTLMQKGKDFRGIPSVIGTGGPIVFSPDPKIILEGTLWDEEKPHLLKPRSPAFFVDIKYALYAVGVLGYFDPKKALRIAKKNLKKL